MKSETKWSAITGTVFVSVMMVKITAWVEMWRKRGMVHQLKNLGAGVGHCAHDSPWDNQPPAHHRGRGFRSLESKKGV